MADASVNIVSMTEKQKVKEITDKLEEGLKELFESERYKSYLSTMSKFHNYSINNTLLIAMQKPEATLVAGYQAWQKNFNRHVKKGEKGIRILAPAPYKIKEERDKLDPVTGEIMLDKDGMPQTEEVEIKIPAFRAVAVFDISQTDGEPIPELEAKELLSTVEGYEDFIKALTYVAPAPIGFEDIPGSSKGYFNTEENRIAVQEGMSESQTLKTMVHETAHSMLHNKEVNKDVLAPAKDRNTKEVEAESIAYTVCQHFGIDTSEYSFGYIAGWSSGKDMNELRSSLDTIRKTASEIITGIEGQLKELQRDREMMQEQDQEKGSFLLIQNSDLSEYTLVNVRGMDVAELIEALSGMNDADKLSVAAYLESKGAWTTEIANEETREFEEYHIDVQYITDTNEVIDLKAEMELDERAKEPIGKNDVILKIIYADGFEVERITNKTPEEVQEIMGALAKLEDKNRKSIRDCLKNYGTDYIPISVSGGRNSIMPQFNDFEIDLVKKNIFMMHHRSQMQQAECIINRLEFAKTAFSDDERNLIVNYAYKLNDMEKTRELAEHIYYEEAKGNQGAALAVIDAQAEIDALPDPKIGLSEMEEYGYTREEMLPLTKETALELFDHDLPVYLLYEDGSETSVGDRKQITGHDGIFGIEKGDWENEKELRTMQAALDENSANKEAQLLYGSTDKYGIYQLKDNSELRQFHFEGTESLKRIGIIKDNFDAIKPENYSLIYVGELSELQRQSQEETLETIYEKFNIAHPKDYRGHSLSVSDIVVLHENGKNSAHFVDSFGFTELPDFVRVLEGVKEQEIEKAEPEEKYPAVYHESLNYAMNHGEADKYLESRRLDRECKEAIEETIRQNFDGMSLKDDIVKPLSEQYGSERIAFVLANTLQQESWDRRFSKDNKAWASEFSIPENIVHGMDMNVELIVGSHPVVLDGLISMFRREVLEQEKELSTGQEKVTSGHDVPKPKAEQTEAEKTDLEDMDDGDEIIDLGDEKDQVLAEMKQSLEGRQDTSGHDVNQSAKQNDLKLEQAEPEVTLTVAECGEFHNLGEFYKNIPTVEEAVAIWKQIPPERMHGIPAIGVNIHTPGTEVFEDVGIDILTGKRIDLDMLEYIPDIKGNPQAMEVIAELVAMLPEMEIDGIMSEEFEAKVWEKRMPDLSPAEQLAVELDRFTYDYNTTLYHDNTQSMTENVSEIADALKQRDTRDIAMWLADVTTEGTEPEETKRAMELLEKLTEYKPLAKIEEMEEQNYNMVDNVLNNGAGEKAGKEENKKEQERPAAGTSLKARLAEKKALVYDQGKDHEAQANIKNNQREM